MRRFPAFCVASAFVAALPAAAATLTVTNANDSGPGSLREAILSSNSNFTDDFIEFDIPGAGVHTIVLASPLPAITEPVTIDGYSQPGASPNTQPVGQGLNTVLTIEVDCTGTGISSCMTVNAGNSEVLAMIIQGLVVNRSAGTAITVVGDGVYIVGNFIGTDPTGSFSPGPQRFGIGIGAQGVVIGGTTPFERNLISGAEVGIITGGSSNMVVVGNLIGTDAAGTAPIPSEIGIQYVGNATIGGTSSAHRNVISGNGKGIVGTEIIGTIQGNHIGTDATGTQPLGNDEVGIELNPGGGLLTIKGNVLAANGLHGISGCCGAIDAVPVIQGNFIGTDETASRELGNGDGGGIFIADSAIEWTIGGPAGGQGNIIAYNFGASGSAGIGVDPTATRVRIRGNRIFANSSLGIELVPGGVQPNDPGDADDGANHLQNYPMITSVAPGASTTHIEGILNSTPSTTFLVDLYADSACRRRPQNDLQGDTYLGALQVVTDGSGNTAFEHDLPFVLGADRTVTATATDPEGNTSEFSPRILRALAPPSGPAGGGTISTLSGMLYEPGATVTVGGIPATNVDVTSTTTILATMPARPAGSAHDVTVVNPSGIQATLANGWVADFLDVPAGQQFHDFVVRVVANGIATGVGGGNYGVGNPTLRQQMAVFLLKGKHGVCYVPPPCTGTFDDVPCPSQFADWIEALGAEGITGGCGVEIYCPQNPVRRDQMAVFLLKAGHGSSYAPPPCTGEFSDVTCPSQFADWVEQLAAENITGGCGGNNYCPLSSVTRGQMAVFVSKTFGLP